MNLRQLINSNAKVIKGYPDNEDGYKDFTETSLGNIIDVNTNYHTDGRLGIKHMIMYITTSGEDTKSSVQLYSRKNSRSKREAKHAERRIVSTYTVAVSFSDYYTMTIPTVALFKTYLSMTGEYNTARDRRVYSDFQKMHPELAELINRDERAISLMSRFEDAKIDFKRKDGDPLKIDQRAYDLEQRDVKSHLDQPEAQEQFFDYLKNINGLLNKSAIKELVEAYIESNKETSTLHFSTLPYRVVSANNKEVKIETLITLDNPIRVKCTCSQFYYTYAWYNANHNVLIGERPPAYVKLTGDNRLNKFNGNVTVRNKNRIPGMCKHLQLFISYLMQEGIIIADKYTNKYIRSTYASNKGLKTVTNILKRSEAEGTLGSETDLELAKKEFKDAKRDEMLAYMQNKLFGINNRKIK